MNGPWKVLKEGLRVTRLLRPAVLLKRWWVRGEVSTAFMPCTPHLLIAINRALVVAKAEGLEGDYLEFGIYRGFALWYAQALAKDLGLQAMRFFGFDSFQGLPPLLAKEQGHEFREGAYEAYRWDVERDLERYGCDPKRTILIEGWFDRTLTEATRRVHGLERCAVCVIDCDLYESTRLALRFLAPLVGRAAVVLFDDWNSFKSDPHQGERRAFAEFLAENPALRAEPLLEFGGHGQGFILKRLS